MRQPVPLVGGYGVDGTRHWLSEDTLNYLPAKSASGGSKTPFILRQAPGLRPLLDTQDGPVRGMAEVEGRLYVVAGTQLYQVQPNLLQIPCGTIPGVGRVSMAHNQRGLGNELVIDNGSARYVLNTATLAFQRVTDEAFPGSFIAFYVDQYLGYVEPQGRFWGHSDLADALSYNSLDTYEAEGDPDRIVTAHVSHREVLIFGRTTIEPFVNSPSGSGIAPFVRASNTVIETGCAARYSVASMDGAVLWLDDKRIVRQMNGYQAVRVSNEWVEQALAEASADAIADAYAFTWEDKGFKVYYLTIPGVVTFGYDLTTGEWARRSSPGLETWRLGSLVFWNGQWVGGDIQDGKLYALDWNYFRDGQDELVRERSSGVLTDNQNAMMVHEIELLLGVGGPESEVGDFFISPTPPTIEGAAPFALIDTAYSYSYTVGGAYPPLAVSLFSGALPPGLTISTAGVLSGTPTGGGSFSWVLRVTDANGLFDSVSDSMEVASVGPWFFGPVAINGASGGSEAYYKTTLDPTDWSAAPIALPGGIGSLSRITVANNAVFMLGTSGQAVSFNRGASWTACTGLTAAAGFDVFWNGSHYYHNTQRSSDGITWGAIPNLPTNTTIRLARQSDGAVIGYRTSTSLFQITVDGGTNWTVGVVGPGGSVDTMATDGSRITFNQSSTIGRYTDDLFATGTNSGASTQYSSYESDGVFVCKGLPTGLRRLGDGSTQGSVAVSAPTNAREAANVFGAESDWIFSSNVSGTPGVNTLHHSADGGATWSVVATLYGAGGNVACVRATR